MAIGKSVSEVADKKGMAVASRNQAHMHQGVKVPFVDLKTQYAALSGEVNASIAEVFDNCDFILGSKVRSFEKDFASYCGSSYSLGVSSGTSALHLALRALSIGPGDEVITQANTFIATVLAISYAGATPVLVDVDEKTFNLDPTKLSGALSSRTRAIIPVHLYGQTAPMDEITGFAKDYGLKVIEDACQAHGASYNGSSISGRAGTLGDVAAFSFYPGKNLGAYGDGGALTTDNLGVYEKLRMLRDYGQSEKYHHKIEGFNSRLDTMQAAVLSVKLKRLDAWNKKRALHAAMYTELLSGIPEVKCPQLSEGHVYHLYVVRVQEREGLAEFLSARGISTGIHYPVPNHLQPAFKRLGYVKGSFPVTERLSGEIISLPMFPELEQSQIRKVSDAIRDFYGR